MVLLTAGLVLTATVRAPEERPQSIVDARLAAFSPAGPGCVCAVIRDGETVASGAVGLASLEHRIPLDSGSVLHVGSIAKHFIAATVHAEVEAKNRALAVPPDVRGADPAVISHLVVA